MREMLISPYVLGSKQIEGYIKATPCLKEEAFKTGACTGKKS